MFYCYSLSLVPQLCVYQIFLWPLKFDNHLYFASFSLKISFDDGVSTILDTYKPATTQEIEERHKNGREIREK